uniref:Ubiquitin-like protein FUBI n=1 Tax=Phallusia mammillata TaxID=59560 RepID=A0A6F9DC09_9ASCI|nr:ubiquitin-like protein FUBI [Phallusia mammillata]
MQLFLRSDKLHCVQVDENDLVLSLVEKIQSLEGLSFEDQVLSYHGTVLEVEQTIAGAGISDLATIDILGRLHGGKVHGSLARAGKVKGQTPKVDAQEKKKKKTGRAMRRMQYNRRFVNVVQTFGRRRGPNSNS